VPSSSATLSSGGGEQQIFGEISMWYGKVNQYKPTGGSWSTDPDGTAGAGNFAQFGADGFGDRKVEYCQRFWPDTESVEEAGLQKFSGWMGRGNIGNSTSTKMVYDCLGEEQVVEEISCGDTSLYIAKTSDSPNGSIESGDPADLFKFRIKNNSECLMGVGKIAVQPASSDGLLFVNKNDLYVENVSTGEEYNMTNVNPPYTNTVAWFTVVTDVPAGGYVDFMLKTSDVEYYNPFGESGNMILGGVAYGVGQLDAGFYNSGISFPVFMNPVWGNVLTVLQ